MIIKSYISMHEWRSRREKSSTSHEIRYRAVSYIPLAVLMDHRVTELEFTASEIDLLRSSLVLLGLPE